MSQSGGSTNHHVQKRIRPQWKVNCLPRDGLPDLHPFWCHRPSADSKEWGILPHRILWKKGKARTGDTDRMLPYPNRPFSICKEIWWNRGPNFKSKHDFSTRSNFFFLLFGNLSLPGVSESRCFWWGSLIKNGDRPVHSWLLCRYYEPVARNVKSIRLGAVINYYEWLSDSPWTPSAFRHDFLPPQENFSRINWAAIWVRLAYSSST